MNLRLFSMALALGIGLLGFSVTAHADAAADFALFAKGKSGGNPDRCITICGESAQLAGQMSIIQDNGKPTCQNVTCGAGGVAPPC